MIFDTTQNMNWLMQCLQQGFASRSDHSTSGATEKKLPPNDDVNQPEPQNLNRTLIFLAETIAETMMIDPQLAAALASCEENLPWQELNNGADCLLSEANPTPPNEDKQYGFFLMSPRIKSDAKRPGKAQLWWVLAGSCVIAKGDEIISLGQNSLITTPSLTSFTIKTQTQPCLLAWCR